MFVTNVIMNEYFFGNYIKMQCYISLKSVLNS